MWEKLWALAIGFEDVNNNSVSAAIIVDPETQYRVTLRWDDGSESYLYWHGETKHWRFAEQLNGCPGDVAARDSL